MTAEVVRRIPNDAQTIQSRPRLTLEPEPTLYRPLQEEELMKLRTTELLLPHVNAAIRKRFPFHVEQLMGAIDIAITQYDGHKPRRDGTEAALHPVRTLYRALTADPDLTLIRGATLVLHDTPEDCGLNQRDHADLLGMHRFSPEDARRIAFGADGMSRVKGDTKLSQEEYLDKLEAVHWADPDLGIIINKTWDGIDNIRNDIWLLISDSDAIDPMRALKFLDYKARDVLALAKKYAPKSPSTAMLEETMAISRELALHELTKQRRHTTLPTARVPV